MPATRKNDFADTVLHKRQGITLDVLESLGTGARHSRRQNCRHRDDSSVKALQWI